MNELAKRNENELATTGGLGIEGLEDVPVSVLPVPFLRLVQPSSRKIDLANGKEAGVGNYYYNDTQTELESLKFALLKAKVGKSEYEVDGEMRISTKLNILGFDLERKKVFILTLSVMSISNFGSLVANFKQKEANKTWEYEVVATSSKRENKKGKFYVAEFQLGEKIDPKVLEDLENNAKAYGSALNRDLSETDATAVEVEIEPILTEEPKSAITPLSEEQVKEDDELIAQPENIFTDESPVEKAKKKKTDEEVSDLDDLPF